MSKCIFVNFYSDKFYSDGDYIPGSLSGEEDLFPQLNNIIEVQIPPIEKVKDDKIEQAEGRKDNQVQDEPVAYNNQLQAAEEDHSEPDSRSLPEDAKIYDEAQQAIFTEKLQEYFAAKSVKTKKAKDDNPPEYPSSVTSEQCDDEEGNVSVYHIYIT